MLPVEIDAINDRVLDEWRRVDAELARLQAEIVNAPNEARRRARLAELRRTVKAETKGLRDKTRAWIEGELPGVYMLGAETAALSLGVKAAFTQANREAFYRIALDTHDDLLAATRFVEADTKRWIREVAANRTRYTIGAGDPAKTAARALARDLKPISAVRYSNGALHGVKEYAEVVVRTKTAVAYNGGSLDVYDAAEVAFVEVVDGPGCHWYSHDDGPPANGLIVSSSEARAHPIAHPNCIMPGQDFVPVGRLEAIERAWYSGPAATIHATTGTGTHPVTVGPNHPMLTRRGWVLARFLEEGDELAYHGALDATLHAGNEAYLQQVPAIEDAFGAVRSVGASAFVPATRHDLHGDGLWAEGEVEIVRPAGDLLRVTDASAVEHLGEHSLVRANPDDKPLAGESVGDAFLGGDSLAASPCVGRADESTPSSVVETLPAEAHCFTSRPAEPEASELASHGAVSDAVIQGDGLARLPGEVAPGDVLWVELAPSRHAYAPILSVEISHFEGWVFDATTEHGYYLVRAYCASNCRRSFSPRPDLESPTDAATATPTKRTAPTPGSAAPRSPETPPTPGRSPRTPRGQREPRRPRAEATQPTPATVAPAPAPAEGPPAVFVKASDRIANENRIVKLGPEFDRALAAIDKGHSLPADVRRVPARSEGFVSQMQGTEGHFARVTDGRPVEIGISPEGVDPANTLTHEFGHFVDYEAIPRAVGEDPQVRQLFGEVVGLKGGAEAAKKFVSYKMETNDAAMNALAEWWRAVDSSRPVGRIRRLSANMNRSIFDREFADYLGQPSEIWARSYAQWVSEKDPELAARMRRTVVRLDRLEETSGGNLQQWTGEEFAPIRGAFDKLFATLGWAS